MAETCTYENLFEFTQYDGQCDYFGGTTPLPVRPSNSATSCEGMHLPSLRWRARHAQPGARALTAPHCEKKERVQFGPGGVRRHVVAVFVCAPPVDGRATVRLTPALPAATGPRRATTMLRTPPNTRFSADSASHRRRGRAMQRALCPAGSLLLVYSPRCYRDVLQRESAHHHCAGAPASTH